MATTGSPPCELWKPPKPHTAQVYVLKASAPSGLLTVGSTELVEGAGAFAVVQSEIDGTFLVVALGRPQHFESAAAKLKQKVQQLPGDPLVEWVRPLTRRLQRLLGWGDVLSTKEGAPQRQAGIAGPAGEGP